MARAQRVTIDRKTADGIFHLKVGAQAKAWLKKTAKQRETSMNQIIRDLIAKAKKSEVTKN